MAGFTERKQALHRLLRDAWCCGETVEESAWKQQIWLRIVLGIPKHKCHSKPERLRLALRPYELGPPAIVYSYLDS